MASNDVKQLRIAVFGAGMAGLSCALALAREGFQRIEVYEASSGLGFVGAGIQLAPNMIRILDKLGVWESIKRDSVALKSTTVHDGATDNELGSVDLEYVEQSFGYPHMVGHRASLADGLYAGCKSQSNITFHFSTTVSSYDFSPPSFMATPRGGEPRRVEADIILAGDGIKSSTRVALLNEIEHFESGVIDSGQAAYRIMLTREQLASDPELLELIDYDGVVRWIGARRHIIAYPIDGKRIYNLSTAQPDVHFASAPTAEYTTRGSKQQMLEVFADFCPRVQKLLNLVADGDVCEWKLRVHAPLPTWVHRSIALLGDAAHPTLPHMAQGAAQAIEDGCAVAIVLSRLPDTSPENINKALKIYETVRKSRADTLVELAAANGRLMHLGEGKAKEERDAMFAKSKEGKAPLPDRWADKDVQRNTYGFDCALETEKACTEAGW
ncbi:hypothetical protein D9619_007443 [Psilocybe cf. subviscida]|uniref:FAD-binding domain-containing protein n=1 Tax=Psilocybe cf. subviscida TaxID=2480587 RepID=A0A8H5EWV6_9AGAR|nr:hypothetical protein D9619_007443 [Psilocybe cf. subviscida]